MSANPRDIPTMRMVIGSTSERYNPTGDISYGLIRYNTTDNNVEAYAKDGWVNLQGGSGGGKWTLGANGSSNYTFEGPGLTGAVNNPTLYLVRGNKYTFVNQRTGESFQVSDMDLLGSNALLVPTQNELDNKETFEFDISVPENYENAADEIWNKLEQLIE